MNTFYIDKTKGTFSDELLAAGFIRLLEALLAQQGHATPSINQIDHGHYYKVVCTPPLDLTRVETETQPFALVPIVRTVKNAKKLSDLPPSPVYVIDYDKERDQRGAYFTAFKDLEKSAKAAWAKGEDHPAFASMPPDPHRDWDIFRLLNPMALIGYNSLMVQWYKIGQAGQIGALCKLTCELFAQTPNKVTATIQTRKSLAKEHNWLVVATASQFFNPSQGKGINKPLPNGVGLGNLKNFWLLEWLKAVGFYQIGITRLMKGVKDRKTYVPSVGRSDLIAQRDVYNLFRKRMPFAESAVRSDILTVIRYVLALIDHVEAAQAAAPTKQELTWLTMLGEQWRPADFVHGFHTVFYKDLGNAVTTMNISFLNLPNWIELRQPEDRAIYTAILEEYEQIVRQFAENKGEEIDLLQQFRDFIVADNLDPFFEFTTAYSSWLISQGEKKGGFPPRRLNVNNLRRLIMSSEPALSPILESKGFQNVAYAIRQSTVTAQYKRKQGDRRYDVRYGLGRDLVRQSQYSAEFVAALSDFMHKYNA
ncbi:MAG TPA: hypothetical protein ENJ56_06930, partial [Anaerolineae bacterium]|nr:hypothetical protein [Anaerolineae bacterium]